MKRHGLVYLLALVLAFAGAGFSILAASTSAPGSADDPLVSKSYVEQRLASLSLGGVNEESIVSMVMARLEPLIAARGGGGASYAPVSAARGQYVIGGEGCEMILRSGSAICVTSTDGVSDVTAGADIGADGAIAVNHLLIVPRADGRGARVTSESAWFLIKGSYTIR